MENERKLEQLRVLIAREEKTLKDIESLAMADLSPMWPTLSEKALAINKDLRILLPLAAEVQPLMVEQINALKEAVVNMRIDSYNKLNDVTFGEHQEPEVCKAMLAYGIANHKSERGIEFCLNECPYQARCLDTEQGANNIVGCEL